MTKCPVCDCEIKDAGVSVKTRTQTAVVCCQECADKLKESDSAQGSAGE